MLTGETGHECGCHGPPRRIGREHGSLPHGRYGRDTRCGSPGPRAWAAIAAALVTVHLVGSAVQRWTPAGPPVTPLQLQLRLNPNTASAAELELLPRIGPTIAANIVAYHAAEEQPAFRRAEDLDRVPRIGPATVEALRLFLAFPEAPELPPP
jgi:hypothetical protein